MASDKTSLAALKGLTRAEVEDDPVEPQIRLTADLSASDHYYLKVLAAESRTTISNMVRAAVKLMRESDDVAAQVGQRAKRLRAGR